MSKSSSRRKTRRLWLKVKFNAKGASFKQVAEYLIKSIERGDYEYPHQWRVALGWSNKENGTLKWGEWTKEMKASAESSEGFQFAVRDYLESQLEQL
jgi:hypothetical protein